MPKVDLHIHTHFSDGTLTPEEVVREAKKRGFSAIAITDHDSVDAIAPAMKEAEKCALEIIPAVEFTTEENDTEIHILGYFIDYKNKKFEKLLDDLREKRKKRIKKILVKLKNLGIEIQMEDILKIAGPGSIGRLHLALCLKEKGYVKNIYEAFSKYIGEGKPAYEKGALLTPVQVLELIKNLGGAAVLAHPNTLKSKKLVKHIIKLGIAGIEVYHSGHTQELSNYFLNLAKENNLLITGGSDCHGLGKGRLLLGSVELPYSAVEKLREKTTRQNV